jgi:hypothetical protein
MAVYIRSTVFCIITYCSFFRTDTNDLQERVSSISGVKVNRVAYYVRLGLHTQLQESFVGRGQD